MPARVKDDRVMYQRYLHLIRWRISQLQRQMVHTKQVEVVREKAGKGLPVLDRFALKAEADLLIKYREEEEYLIKEINKVVQQRNENKNTLPNADEMMKALKTFDGIARSN